MDVVKIYGEYYYICWSSWRKCMAVIAGVFVILLIAEIANANVVAGRSGQWVAGMTNDGGMYAQTTSFDGRAILRFAYAGERLDSPVLMVAYNLNDEWLPIDARIPATTTVGGNTIQLSSKGRKVFANLITKDFVIAMASNSPNGVVVVNTTGPSVVFSLDGFPQVAVAMMRVIEGNK